MATDDVQELADELAVRLGRSVTIVDPEIRILCASAHYGDEDEARVRAILQRVALPEVYRHIHAQGVRDWTRPGRVPASPELHFQRRLVIPIRRRDRLLAFVMIIEGSAGDLPAALLAEAEQSAGLMADSLDEAHRQAEGSRARRRELLTALVDDRAEVRRAAVAATDPPFAEPGDRVTVLAVTASGTDPRQAPARLGTTIEAAVENLALSERPRPQCAARGAAAPVVTALVVTVAPARERPGGADDARRLAHRVVGGVTELAGPATTVVAGLPDGPCEVGGMHEAWTRARVAAEGARRLPRLGPVTTWGELGVHRTLLRLSRPDLEAAVPPGLRELAGHDPRGVLRATLAAYLDEAGAAPATARRLNLHRTSLYYRLDQITARTGLDLHDGSARLDLHLGLRALELIESAPPSDPDPLSHR